MFIQIQRLLKLNKTPNNFRALSLCRIQIQRLLKLNNLILLSLSKILSDSNTTIVKVKCHVKNNTAIFTAIQIQRLLKLNRFLCEK